MITTFVLLLQQSDRVYICLQDVCKALRRPFPEQLIYTSSAQHPGSAHPGRHADRARGAMCC